VFERVSGSQSYRYENKRKNFVRVYHQLVIGFNFASSSFKFADRGHIRSSTLRILHQPFSSSTLSVVVVIVRQHRPSSFAVTDFYSKKYVPVSIGFNISWAGYLLAVSQ